MAATITEINTYFGRCRCCLNYGYVKNMWEEYYWQGEMEIYVQMLVQCFALSWEPTEESKKFDQICESCVVKLRDANIFKKTVLESQIRLLDEDPETALKTEVAVLEDCKDDLQSESTADNLCIDPETALKTEVVVLEDCKDDLQSESTADNLCIGEPYDSQYDDQDDPDYVDEDNLEDSDYVDNPEEMDYEEVEYLEDEDTEDVLAEKKPVQVHRKPKGSQPPSDRKWPKKLPKSERYKTYKQYTEEDLRACLDAVRKGVLTPREAAEKYNIPKKTIAAKVKKTTKDDQNGTTTKENSKSARNKTPIRIKPTIIRPNSLKPKDIMEIASTIKNKDILVKDDITSENDQTPESKLNIKQENNVLDVSTENIKKENKNLDTLLNIKQIRSKDKAIVDAKLAKSCKLPKNTDETEMNKHKNNLKQILETSNATMIKGFWGNGYSCCFCNIQKENPLELKAHNLESHSNVGDHAIKGKYVSDLVIRLDITDLKCNICSNNIDSIETFIEHIATDHNKHIYKDIKNHIIPFKFESDILKCVKCGQEFKYFKLLSEHMSVHYSNYECHVCQRSFINKQSMQTHSYRHKNGVFKCSHCPKIFDTRLKKSVHERVTHTLLNKTRKCTFCDERFSTKDLVQSHKTKVHGAKIPVFNCQACNKSYNSQSSLLTHRKRFHLMLRPHKCSYCDMGFYSRNELRSHTVTHTKSRDFKCDVCNKSFGTRRSLNQHVRGHLDNRRFKCDICERTFVHRTARKVHMRSKHCKVV